MIIHVVKPGDSVWSIAQMYGVNPLQVIEENGLTDPSNLVIGQNIVIFVEDKVHFVKLNESIYDIAYDYGVTVEDILKANPSITNPDQLYPGQEIKIVYGERKLRDINVFGYSRPKFKERVVETALNYMTGIDVFYYRVKEDGSIEEIKDEKIINTAYDYGVAPIMVIANLIDSGGFDSDALSTILNDENIQDELIGNIITTMKQKGYKGVDVDFEYIYNYDKVDFENFLRKLTKYLHNEGYFISVALAPKTKADQTGILYEAHDYEVIGQIVDRIMLMTYEWGYIAGPPMAVAPIAEVEDVIKFAVSVVDSDKLIMGIPNYGYDWTLPYKEGSKAKTLSNPNAIELAREFGAEIKFDEQSQTPYFYYYDYYGDKHIVWFENASSIKAKLMLMEKYKLSGIFYWTVMKPFPENWLVLDYMFNINKIL